MNKLGGSGLIVFGVVLFVMGVVLRWGLIDWLIDAVVVALPARRCRGRHSGYHQCVLREKDCVGMSVAPRSRASLTQRYLLQLGPWTGGRAALE